MSSIILAAMSPRRFWQCLTAPDKNKCSIDERKSAKQWIIGVPAAVALAAFAAAGIYVSKDQVENMKEEQRVSEDDPNRYAVEQQHIDARTELNEAKQRLATLRADNPSSREIKTLANKVENLERDVKKLERRLGY